MILIIGSKKYTAQIVVFNFSSNFIYYKNYFKIALNKNSYSKIKYEALKLAIEIK
jgi:hypothetical protein